MAEKRSKIERAFPIGAEVIDGGAHFRVWAPKASHVEVEFVDGGVHGLSGEDATGYFSGFIKGISPGTLYRFRLDGREGCPDPASRFQPQGPYGPSEIIDPASYEWKDTGWPGVRLKGQVIYEMHIGTFTKEGTWSSAAAELAELAAAGITLLEIMPVADFPGLFGWGYDGVNIFAPTRLYGRPEEFKAFVDTAHSLGIGVLLDVVYNHTGPEACFLTGYSDYYFTDKYENEWGQSINYDGEGSGPVREFFITNAAYWIREFHLDGLRLDATQTIFDSSEPHILAEVTQAAKRSGGDRSVLVIAENESQEIRLVGPHEEGGFGMDALWNDDFHHSATVALTGRAEAYYSDYLGKPQEFISAVKWGYLYQGQWYGWQQKNRGTPSLEFTPKTFVLYLQNHDQIANTGIGKRFHYMTSPGKYRAMSALLLLAPATPMLFQGQEFAASSPFLYFCDLGPEFLDSVKKGRKDFLAQFKSLDSPEAQQFLPDPGDRSTFETSKLNLAERVSNRRHYLMHKELLRLRREDPVINAQTKTIDGAVLGDESFVLRFFGKDEDRLLLVNLGGDLSLEPAPEPLIAPRKDTRWKVLWSSQDFRFGGEGMVRLGSSGSWLISAQTTVLLGPDDGGQE